MRRRSALPPGTSMDGDGYSLNCPPTRSAAQPWVDEPQPRFTHGLPTVKCGSASMNFSAFAVG